MSVLTWLAHNWHSFLLALGATLLIYGSFLWAQSTDDAEAMKAPITEEEIAEHGDRTVDDLEAYSQQEYAAAVAFQQGARELDELAVMHPMPQRPGPAPAALDEPWSLRNRAAKRLNRGLGAPAESSVPDVVASGDSESNPQLGDES